VFQFQDRQTIGAHVLILSAVSPVFASMFQGSTDRKVEIVDFEMAIFTQLLTYLYTGVAPRMSEENITPILLEAANKYGVEMLKIECTDVLLTRMTLENNVQTLIWSQKHAASKLFEAALEFLVDNFNTICYRSEWKDLIKNDPDLCMLVTQRVADDRYSLTK
jgi:speckle-type POZ protein